MTDTTDSPSGPSSPESSLPPLLSVAFLLGAFALGTSENIIAGIMPQLSASFHTPLGTVGLLVTAYAATAVFAGPILAVVTGRMPLRSLAILSVAGYAVGTVFAMTAPGFPLILAGRIVTGALHTTVLVTFMITALRLSPAGQQGRTVGRITLGLGIATVAGVPLGNTLAESLGWRWSFVVILLLTVVTLALVLSTFPRKAAAPRVTGLASLRVLVRGPAITGVAMSALAGVGAMTLLSYAVPFLSDGAGVGASAVAPLLLIYGAACLIGNSLGGRLADRDLPRALVLTLGCAALALVLTGLLPSTPWGATVGLVLVGMTYFATFPPLNTWIATSAEDVAPDLALAVNSSAFNIGIAVAGWAGGAALSAGLSASSLPWFGVLPMTIATVAAIALHRR